MDPLALGRRRSARQECPGHASLREQGASLVGILTCQNACRRHDTGLGARIRRNSKRASGNGRLAGADVSQQQTVHHTATIAHVMQDVLECSLLLVTQRERQGLPECGQMLARGMRVGNHLNHTAVVAQTQSQLQVEALLVGKTPARDIALGHARGKVNRSQRTGIAHQAALDAQRGGNGIKRIANNLERAAYDTAHPRLAHAVTHVVDRQYSARGAPFLKLFKVRRGHLLKSVGKLDLTHHGQAVALLKLLGNPGLAEKGDLQHARLVNE